MKKINEEKLIKYLRSLILRSLTAIVLFLVLAILSKSSITYKDLIVSNLYEKNISFSKVKKIYNQYLGGIIPLEKVETNIVQVFNEKLEYKDGTLTVLLNNFDKKIQMIFKHLSYSAFHPSSDWEGDESIYSFAVIKDSTEINILFLLDKKDYLDCMFFVFDMFSGSKFQIVCKELILNVE